jgi:hypothetical protein
VASWLADTMATCTITLLGQFLFVTVLALLPDWAVLCM